MVLAPRDEPASIGQATQAMLTSWRNQTALPRLVDLDVLW